MRKRKLVTIKHIVIINLLIVNQEKCSFDASKYLFCYSFFTISKNGNLKIDFLNN